MTAAAAAPSILTKTSTHFSLADRLRIQQERSRDRDYTVLGRLTAVVFEGQRNIRGLSQSRAICSDFSEKQRKLWASITLDWLSHKNAPVIAMSKDGHDLLLPLALTPLPPIPDPRWLPKKAGDIAPRITQLLTGCPVVGDRVQHKITDRQGRVYGIIHPVTELSIMMPGGAGFGKIRGRLDPTDGTHLALLIDDSDPENLRAFFVGGSFSLGGA
jgi:hypothetical protein